MVEMTAEVLARGDAPIRQRLEEDQGVAQQLLGNRDGANGVIDSYSVESSRRRTGWGSRGRG